MAHRRLDKDGMTSMIAADSFMRDSSFEAMRAGHRERLGLRRRSVHGHADCTVGRPAACVGAVAHSWHTGSRRRARSI